MSRLHEATAELAAVVETAGGDLGPWNHLTCTELAAIVGVLEADDHTEAVTTLVLNHAHGDDDEGDVHHALYLRIEEGATVAEEWLAQYGDEAQRATYDTYKEYLTP